MNPQEKSKKIDSTEYGHPRLNLTAFFGQGRQVDNMYRMVAASYLGDLISQSPKNDQTQPCTTHSVQVLRGLDVVGNTTPSRLFCQ